MPNWMQNLQAASETFAGGIEGFIQSELQKRDWEMSEREQRQYDSYRKAMLAARQAEVGAKLQPKEPSAKDLRDELELEELQKLSPDERKRILFPELYKEEKAEKRPPNVTGVSSYSKIVGERRKATEAAQTDYNALLDYFEQTYPDVLERAPANWREMLSSGQGGFLPNFAKLNDETDYKNAVRIFNRLMRGKPVDFTPSAALADSAETARQDYDMASALMDYEPEGNVRSSAGGQITPSEEDMQKAAARGSDTYHGARTYEEAVQGLEKYHDAGMIDDDEYALGLQEAKVFFGVK